MKIHIIKNASRFLCCGVYLLNSFTVVAGGHNIAGEAAVTASSQLNAAFAPQLATDGIIGVDGKGEWACEGVTTSWGDIRYPWIRLDWTKPRSIQKIVLFDRATVNEHIAGGKLEFSDGSEITVNEIPNNGTAKAIEFAARTVSWVRFVVTDGNGKDLGLSEVEVFPSPSQYSDYVSWVDPFIETNRGRFFFFITGSTPFGMVSAAPHTRNKDQNGGGYNYNEHEILGFSQIHSWMLSGIEVMPARSEVDPTKGEGGWKSAFSHAGEIAQPGYQRLFLDGPRTWVELTATERVAFYRFTFTSDTAVQLITNLGGRLCTSTMANAAVTRVSDTEIEGSLSSIDRFWGGPKDVRIFFVAQFDKAFSSLDSWRGVTRQHDVRSASGDSAGVTALYNVRPGDAVQLKIAISYTSIENARANLKAECADWDFNAVKSRTQAVWNEWLGKIDVQGGESAQKVKFYTDLWHVLLGRQKINDVSGQYPDRTTGKRDGNFTDARFKIKTLPANGNGQPKFNMYNSDAFWLSQWNLNILWGLGWPEIADDMSASLVQYADNGYLLPRGPCGGGYSYIMTSCPATNLLVSTYMKGLTHKTDPAHEYEEIKRNHLPGGMLGRAEDIKFYTQRGWWPDNAGITVEATFQDWAIAQMAKKMGKFSDYRFFSKRSDGWKFCFDTASHLLLPKDRQGKFVHHDLLSGSGWVEANSWQGSFGISHAIPALAAMMGGGDSLCEKLNYAFEKAAPSDFVFDYTSGYVSYANQPGCSNAHVFNYAGQPWKTQYWVRQVRELAYGGTTPDEGYGGHDEDQGQMGGVSALMALGIFSLQGTESTTPVYDITSPIFDSITITLDRRYYAGKTFVIKTHNNSKQNCYIQRATLNGAGLTTFWFRHSDFAKGGTLELWLGPQPNKEWGVSGLPPQ